VSTSELLERIVSGYRHRAFDDKLVKMVCARLSFPLSLSLPITC
jgi:hypothetical protein